MKTLVIVIVIASLIGGIALFFPKIQEKFKTIEYVKVDSEKTITVNPLDAQIKAKEDELTEKYNKIKSLEARISVNQTEIDRLSKENVGYKKELGNFMIASTSKN